MKKKNKSKKGKKSKKGRKRLLATNGVFTFVASIHYMDGNTRRHIQNSYDANYDKPTKKQAVKDLLDALKKPECVEIEKVSVFRPPTRPRSHVGN